MKDLLKKNYKDIILVAVYIIAAEAVYIVLFNYIFRDLDLVARIWIIIGIAILILAIGIIIGTLYIKSIIKQEEKIDG